MDLQTQLKIEQSAMSGCDAAKEELRALRNRLVPLGLNRELMGAIEEALELSDREWLWHHARAELLRELIAEQK